MCICILLTELTNGSDFAYVSFELLEEQNPGLQDVTIITTYIFFLHGYTVVLANELASLIVSNLNLVSLSGDVPNIVP